MRRSIKRIDKFHIMFGRGRGFTEYKGHTDEMELSSCSTAAYSTTRFASSAFENFKKVFCEFQYGNTTITTRFDEIEALASTYNNDVIYEKIGREMCIVVDMALAMGGSEAIVESYYSVMGTQTMAGGQLNDTLIQRTNIDLVFSHGKPA